MCTEISTLAVRRILHSVTYREEQAMQLGDSAPTRANASGRCLLFLFSNAPFFLVFLIALLISSLSLLFFCLFFLSQRNVFFLPMPSPSSLLPFLLSTHRSLIFFLIFPSPLFLPVYFSCSFVILLRKFPLPPLQSSHCPTLLT